MSIGNDEITLDGLTENSAWSESSGNAENKAVEGQLPFMLDFSLSVSSMVVIMVGILTTIISAFSGAALWMTAVRGGVAVVVVGLVLWTVNWIIARDSLEMARLEMIDAMEKASLDNDVESTIEIEA